MATSKGQSKRRPTSAGKARSGAGHGRDGARTKAAVPATPTSRPVTATPGRVLSTDAAPSAEPRVPAPPPVHDEVPQRPDGVPPLWMQLLTFLLSIGGLGVASYETWAHFNGSRLAFCPGNGSENCTAVITSPQSYLFGIPVAILGLVFFVAMVPLFSPWGWQWRRWQPRALGQLRIVSMVAGMGFVMYLIYAELFKIGSWCLYCTIVHIITFVLFCLAVFAAAIWGLPKRA